MRIEKKALLGVGLGSMLLAGIILMRRPQVVSQAPHAKPAPRAQEEAPTSASPAPPQDPIPAPQAAKGSSLLGDLAQAIHQGNDPAIRAILEKLRGILYPPIPDQENAAGPLLEAFSLTKKLIPRGPERAAYDALLDGKDPSPEQLGKLRAWFATNAESVDRATRLMREAADRPRCRFEPGPPSPDDGFVVSTTPFTSMQYASNLLCVQAVLLKADGRKDESAENLRALLGLSQAARAEPTMISQMVGSALNNGAWEMIQRLGVVDGPRLSESVAALDPVGFRRDGERALMGEVYGLISAYMKLKSDSSTVVMNEASRRWLSAPETVPDLALYVQGISEVVALGSKSYGEGKTELDALVLKYGSSSLGFAAAAQGTIPVIPQLLGQLANSEAKADLLRLALELERHRARQGAYPAALEGLQTALPSDPFTGQPFAYRREGAGFILEEPGNVGKAGRLSWKSRP